jgi:MFS family permease
MTDSNFEARPKRSLFGLIGSLPGLISDLIRAEVDRLKDEIATKLKAAGIGLAIFAVAALFGFFALAVLLAAAILGIAVALPAWLAALIGGVVLLIITGILAFLGMKKLQAGTPPTPENTISSVKQDVRVLTGKEKRDTL